MAPMLLSLALAQGRVASTGLTYPQQLLWEADRLVAIDGTGEAVVLDAETLSEERRLDLGRWPDGVKLSGDGRMLLSPSRKVRVTDLDTGETVYLEKRSRWGGAVYGLTSDGRLVRGEETLEVIWLDGSERREVHSEDCCWTQVGEAQGRAWGMSYGLVQWGDSSHLVSESVWSAQALDGTLVALHGWGQTQLVDLESGRVSWEAPPGIGAVSGPMVVSGDGARMAWATSAGTVEVWDRPTETPVATLGTGVGVSGLAWSPDGATLALLRQDGLVELHEVQREPRVTGRPLLAGFSEDLAVAVFGSGWVLTWRRDEDGVYRPHRRLLLPLEPGWEAGRSAALTSDGRLVAATHHGTVETWDLHTGSMVGPPLPGARSDTDVAVGDDGSLAVRAGAWLFTFNGAGQPIARMPASSAPLAVGRGGTRVVVKQGQGLVLYDAVTARSVDTVTLDQRVGAVRFDEDDVLLESGGDLMRWTPGQEPVTVYAGDESTEASVLAGGRMLTRSWEGVLECDDVSVSPPALSGSQALGLHPSEMQALRVDETGRVELVDLVSGERTLLLGKPPGTGAVSALDGRWAVIRDGAVELDDGSVLRAGSTVTALALTPGGPVAGTEEGGLVRWVDGEPRELSVGEAPIVALAWRGGSLVSLDGYGGVSGWDPDTLDPRPLPYAYAGGVALGPDGQPHFALGWDGVYALEDGAWSPLKLRRRHARTLQGALAVCSDGTVVAGQEDWTRPDRFLSGTDRLKPLEGAPSGVTVLRCEERLAMGTWGGLVAVLDPVTGERKALLAGDGTQVVGLDWLDADTLVVAWASGEVRELDLD